MRTITRTQKTRKRSNTKNSADPTLTGNTLVITDSDRQMLLQGYANEIRSLIKTTLESAVRIGQILQEVRTKLLDAGQWQNWVDNEFSGDLKHDTAINFINLANLYAEYAETHGEGLSKLSLSALYHLGRSSVSPEVKETVLELAANDTPLTRDDVLNITRTYRKVKLIEAGVKPEIVEIMQEATVAENPKELAGFSRLSNKKQTAVAELFSAGDVQSTKEALKILSVEKKTAEVEKTLTEVEYTAIKEVNYKTLEEIPNNSVNLAIIEAPLRSSFVTNELSSLSYELNRVLAENGYALITVGHKGSMFCGDKLQPLHPLHLLCLRRRPGNSRTIIGTNITSASVFMAFAYKGVYRAPKTMLVDLHTFGNIDTEENPESITQLDEVEDGIERGFNRIITSLVQRGDIVLHYVASDQHFNIRTSLKESCIENEAASFIAV